MHPNETLLRGFFARLGARDAAGAGEHYHPEVFFTNPLFPRLHGARVEAFWAFALEAVAGWRFEVHELHADAEGGRAEWTARYSLGGREIATRGRSMFAFADGRIRRHYDHFSLWRWCAAALGPVGAALGWLGPYRWAVRQVLARRLEREAGISA